MNIYQIKIDGKYFAGISERERGRKMKCYFCGEPTEGRKFVGKNFFTNEKEEFDVCENCFGPDLEESEREHEEHLADVRKEKHRESGY